MEDTHGDFLNLNYVMKLKCLNPYYNGRYSWSYFIRR